MTDACADQNTTMTWMLIDLDFLQNSIPLWSNPLTQKHRIEQLYVSQGKSSSTVTSYMLVVAFENGEQRQYDDVGVKTPYLANAH